MSTPPKFPAPTTPNQSQMYIEPLFRRNTRSRSTMPSNFHNQNNRMYYQNPQIARIQENHCPSPSASHISTETTYTQPWNSTRFDQGESPSPNGQVHQPPYLQQRNSPRLMQRSASMRGAPPAAENSEKKTESGMKYFPKVSVWKKFIPSKKSTESKKSKAEKKTESTSSTASTSVLPSSKDKDDAKLALVSKMQQEDKKKLYLKVGMKQSQKMNNVQRMQMERQRDFNNAQNQKIVSTKRTTEDPTYDRIDSMIVFKSPAKKSRDQNEKEEEEPLNAPMKSSGPSMTSTPKVFTVGGNREAEKQPEEKLCFDISNVRSVSSSSLSIAQSESGAPTTSGSNFESNNDVMPPSNSTVYYSTTALADSSYSVVNKKSGTMKTIKQEKIDDSYEKQLSASNPSSKRKEQHDHTTEPSELLIQPSAKTPTFEVPPTNPQNNAAPSPDKLIELWDISKVLKMKHQLIETTFPNFNAMRNRLCNISVEKLQMLLKGEDPNIEELKLMWKIVREEEELKVKINELNMILEQAKYDISVLETKRDSLLSEKNIASCTV